MSEQNQSFLRFSLEESIWFPKGFEVSELYSLSIEPDVNIIEKDQYVVIEGNLDISGEYRGFTNQQEGESLEQEQSHSKLVQDVFLREEDGINIFNHRFPVDISIPANRIEDRNSIEVEISTFDYSMPERNCIKLISELLISGLYDGAVKEENSVQADELRTPIESMIPNHANTNSDNVKMSGSEINIESSTNQIPTYEAYALSEESLETVSQREEQAYESFTVEAYALPRQESADIVEEEAEQSLSLESYTEVPAFSKPFQEPAVSIPMPVFKAPEMEYTGLSESVRNNLESQGVRDKTEFWSEDDHTTEKEPSVLLESQGVRDKTEFWSEDDHTIEKEPSVNLESQGERKQSEFWSEDDHSTQKVPIVNFESKGIESEETSIVDLGRSEEESLEINNKQLEEESLQINFNRSEEVQEEVEEEEEAPERSRSVTVSLTDFFGKKDTQTHTRLTVYIVQEGDSLSAIAGRYEVSRLDLLSINELDSENDVQEGQVLYIPKKTVNK